MSDNKSLDHVLALVNAGFTKDDILKMVYGDQDPAPKEPEKSAEVPQEPEPAAAKQEEKLPTEQLQEVLDGFVGKMQGMIASMQAANLTRTELPAEVKKDASDLIADIIF